MKFEVLRLVRIHPDIQDGERSRLHDDIEGPHEVWFLMEADGHGNPRKKRYGERNRFIYNGRYAYIIESLQSEWWDKKMNIMFTSPSYNLRYNKKEKGRFDSAIEEWKRRVREGYLRDS